MASLVILGTGTIPAQAQRTTTNRPNSALVTAIRNVVGSNISNVFNRIEYFLAEVDLNNDGSKEVVVYTAGPHCGTSECPVYIFRKSGNSYLLIGRTGAMSNGGQIAVLPSRSNGWRDIATLVYNPQQRTANWKLHRFNGKSYQNTFQNLSSKPNQIILRPNRGSGISLADSGIASSQVLAQVNQRLTSIRGINLDKVQYIPSETSGDAELNKAIIKWITSTGGNFTNEDFRRLSYYYNRVDLNGDGKLEVLVYLVGGSPSCGTGGCHTLIFKTVGTGYDLVSEIGLTRLPIIVTERKTNGWKDLIILTVGGGARANYWLVRFNGRTYPENPGSGSEVPSNSTVTGRAVMSETSGFSGIALQPQDSQIATGRSQNTGQQSATERSPSSGQHTTGENSLLVAANSQSIRGVTVPLGDSSKQLLAGYGFILDRPNSIRLPDGTLVYSLVVFNTGYADGVVEVYDARNKLIEVRGITGIRNPATDLYAFPFEAANRLFKLATEGYGLGDPRNAVGRSEKTEIRNIAIPPGGRMIFTKNGERAMRYNQATFVIGVLADSVLPKIFDRDNLTFKTKLLSSLYIELQKAQVDSLVQDGMFLTLQDSRRAFANQNWIENQNLFELMKTGSKVLAQESLNYGVDRTVVNQLVLGKKVKFWVTAAENSAKASNVFLQWLDWERSRNREQQDGQPFGISNPIDKK
jgi:hypothetical protein